MTTVLGILGLAMMAVFGSFFFDKKKDEAVLAENTKVKEELKKTDAQISENKASLQGEEVKRLQLLEDMKKAQDEKVTSDDVVDFFNKRQ